MSEPTLPTWEAIDGAHPLACPLCRGTGTDADCEGMDEQGEPEPAVDDAEREAIYREAFEAGRRAGLDARPPASVLVEVPATWSQLAARDYVRGFDGALWQVRSIGRYQHGGQWYLGATLVSGDRVNECPNLDPNGPATLLVTAAERDAVDTLATHLGGVVLGRTDTAA